MALRKVSRGLLGLKNLTSARCISTSVFRLQKSEEEILATGMQGGTTPVTDSDKWILKNFGTGKYASTDEIPNNVRSSELDRARSKARIFISSFAIACLLVCCGFSVYYGKLWVEEGQNIHNRNMARHSRELAPKSH